MGFLANQRKISRVGEMEADQCKISTLKLTEENNVKYKKGCNRCEIE